MVAHARQLIANGALGEGQRMLALTFMNGARRRLTESLNAEASFRRKFDCLTFDSFAQTLVRRRDAKLTDEVRQQAEELFEWMEAGAYFYVCGDAARMAGDVDTALREIIGEKKGLDEAGVQAYMDALVAAGRYQRDVY